MRILLAHKFFHLTGGAEVFFLETGRLLKERHNEVFYFSTNSEKNIESDCTGYFVDPPEYKTGSFLNKTKNIGKAIYSNEAKNNFKKLIKEKKPDIIHVFAIHVHLTPSILVAASELGIPVVMSCNDYKHICPNYKLYHHGRICTECQGGKFYRAVVNRCCKNSLSFSLASSLEAYTHSMMGIYKKYVHTYLFASKFMAEKTEEFWGKGTFRWDILRNPFDSKKYPLVENYEDYALYFGRLVDEKGVDVLVKAASYVPQVRIKIVGNGPDEKMLKEFKEKLGLSNVEFLGPVWGDALDGILAKARFIVVPSVWHENFPYVINQSFAFGKPVIGSDRGGIPEMVEHGVRGLVYPAQDDQALAMAMETLWNKPEETQDMGRKAKFFVDNEFNDEKQYNKLMEIYERVLNA